MTVDRWDDFPVREHGNLHDQLVGRTLTFGDPEIRGQKEHTITVAEVLTVTVGLDSQGIFAIICVADTGGTVWYFSSGGDVYDLREDHLVSGYRLTCRPVAA